MNIEQKQKHKHKYLNFIQTIDLVYYGVYVLFFGLSFIYSNTDLQYLINLSILLPFAFAYLYWDKTLGTATSLSNLIKEIYKE